MAPPDDRTAETRILEALAKAGPCSYKEVVTETGLHEAQVARLLERLMQKNMLLKTNSRYVLPKSTGAPVTTTGTVDLQAPRRQAPKASRRPRARIHHVEAPSARSAPASDSIRQTIESLRSQRRAIDKQLEILDKALTDLRAV